MLPFSSGRQLKQQTATLSCLSFPGGKEGESKKDPWVELDLAEQ